MAPKTNTQRIAYLTAEYPAVSHTFILREVEALRELGFDISTCSIRKVCSDQLRGPAEKAAALRGVPNNSGSATSFPLASC